MLIPEANITFRRRNSFERPTFSQVVKNPATSNPRPVIGLGGENPVPPNNASAKPNKSIKIFVGGLHPDTTRESIIKLIEDNLYITAGCFQLKTRYPSYSSFCVTVDDNYGHILLCSNIWPPKAKIMHFVGRRRNDTQKKAPHVPTAQKTILILCS